MSQMCKLPYTDIMLVDQTTAKRKNMFWDLPETVLGHTHITRVVNAVQLSQVDNTDNWTVFIAL